MWKIYHYAAKTRQANIYGNKPYVILYMITENYERFDIRIPVAAKQMLNNAAEINGTTLTALVLNAAMDKAREIMQTHKNFVLDNDEWENLIAALETPSKPNNALLNAAKDYQDTGMK